MKINSFLILIFCLIIGFACSGRPRKPAGVLSEKKMSELMVDIRLAEAQLYRDHNRHYSEDSSRLKTALVYAALFKKHSITHEEYKKSMDFYAVYPQLLEEILKDATKTLKIMQEKEKPSDSSQNLQ